MANKKNWSDFSRQELIAIFRDTTSIITAMGIAGKRTTDVMELFDDVAICIKERMIRPEKIEE